MSSSEGIQRKADDCLESGQYEEAVALYDEEIRCNPDLAVLYLNKSLTCLQMGAFYDAYDSAKLGLEKGGDKQQSLCRMGQAAYGMRLWRRAANHFVDVLKDDINNKVASDELKKTMVRLAEQKTAQKSGVFDMKAIFLESKLHQKNIDVEDYVGPIKIDNISGKGRGIRAIEPIKEGCIILVNKAFASGTGEDSITTQVDKIIKLDPKKAEGFFDLYAGADVEKNELLCGKDFRNYNSIKSRVCFNRFTVEENNSQLFLLPSYFNHSCVGNSCRSFFGNVIVIHATADIEKGDEICLSYAEQIDPYEKRQSFIYGNFGFYCTCELCTLDSTDLECKRRNKVYQDIFDAFQTIEDDPQLYFKMCEDALKTIRHTYENRKELRIVLAQMLVLFANVNHKRANLDECIKCLEEALSYLNNPFKYCFGSVFISLAVCYFLAKDMTKAKEMLNESLNANFCMDVEHLAGLNPMYEQILNEMKELS